MFKILIVVFLYSFKNIEKILNPKIWFPSHQTLTKTPASSGVEMDDLQTPLSIWTILQLCENNILNWTESLMIYTNVRV